jgi:hypothetical protein
MRHHKANDPAELRREAHRRRVLEHMEGVLSKGCEPGPQVGHALQFEVPLIAEVRRAEPVNRPPRNDGGKKSRTRKPAQLDLGV